MGSKPINLFRFGLIMVIGYGVPIFVVIMVLFSELGGIKQKMSLTMCAK